MIQDDIKLEDFLDKEIVSVLDGLEKTRKKLLKHFCFSCLFCMFLGFVLFVILNQISSKYYILYLVPFTVAVCGPVAYIEFEQEKYRKAFQNNVISKMIKHIYLDLEYHPDSHLSEEYFHNSKLFSSKVTSYSGNDYISGTVGNTFVEFSEIHAHTEKLQVGLFSKGNYERKPVFNGVFIAAEFNKEFKGFTTVIPVSSENDIIPGIRKYIQKFNSEGELVKLEDVEFNDIFTVFASDQIEARYILTLSLMKRIKEFYKKTGCELRMSFVKSKVYIAVPSHNKMLTPKLFTPINGYSQIQEYFDTILLIKRIVEELNLNNRIWTKG